MERIAKSVQKCDVEELHANIGALLKMGLREKYDKVRITGFIKKLYLYLIRHAGLESDPDFERRTLENEIKKVIVGCKAICLCTNFFMTGGVIIATTRLISMHQNKGKSIADCLADRTDYAKNPDKTNEGEYISSYECDPKTVQGEFMLSKRQYDDITGRKQASNVIVYQIRQSFKPGEITPELANKIGYELGMSFTKGNHAFIVATHVDKSHIHNHIIFNSTSLDCTKKFRDFLGSGRAIAKISDRICLENNLSIIENPKRSKGHYGKWLGDEKPLSHSDKLRQTIDEMLAKKPATFDAFLQLMQGAGFEIKSGKHYAFKGAEQKKFFRLRSLGEGYSEDEIKAIIEGKAPQREVKKSSAKQPKKQEKSVNLLVDIQAKLQQGKGKGYEQWAKIFNLKQMAQTVNFLQEHKLLAYSDLEEKAKKSTAPFDERTHKLRPLKSGLQRYKLLKSTSSIMPKP